MRNGGPEAGPNRRSKESAAQVDAPEAAVQEDPSSKLLDVVQDSNASIQDALFLFAAVNRANQEAGVTGINLLAGLRDVAENVRATAVSEPTAVVFASLRNAYNAGVNAVVEEMNRISRMRTGQRDIASDGPVTRQNLTPAARRRLSGRVIDRPER